MDRGGGRNFLGCSQNVFDRNGGGGGEAEDEEFCNQDNWESSVLYLSQELELLGFPSPCSVAASSSEGGSSLDVMALVNTAWQLLQSHRSCIKTIADLECKMQRMHGDLDRAHEQSARSRDLCESRARQLQEGAERERKAAALLAEEKEKHRISKEEIRRVTSLMQQRDARASHEAKRREQESTKLKDRLLRVMAEKNAGGGGSRSAEWSSPVASIEVSGQLIGRSRRGRANWGTTDSAVQKRLTSYYDKLMDELEFRNSRLRSDNVELTEHLYQLLYRLLTLTASAPDSAAAEPSLLPLDLSRETVMETSEEVLQAVRKRLEAVNIRDE